jgi:MFS family permease
MKVPPLHSGYTQLVMTSVIAMFSSGLFDTLNGLGGAGAADPQAPAMVNTALYITWGLSGLTGGLWFSWLGPRILMSTGALLFALYAVCAYLSGRFGGWADQLWLASGVLLGVGSTFLWTAQGALVMAYAPEPRKGFYISLFWILFNAGAALGGLLVFGLNFSSGAGEVNAASYFVFAGSMAFGGALALLTIVPPATVVREDGVQVQVPALKSFREELRDAVSVLRDRNILLLTPLFFASQFFYAYCFSLNAALFSVRSRGLNAALFFTLQIPSVLVLERVVDDRGGRSVTARAHRCFFMVALWVVITFALGASLQFAYRGGFEALRAEPADVAQPLEFAFPCFVYSLYGWTDSAVQNFIYWVLSVLAGNDSALAARYSAIYKSVQSFGAALAWLLASSYLAVPVAAQFWTSLALLLCGLTLAWPVVAGLRSPDARTGDEVSEPHNVVKGGAVGLA